MIFAGLFNLSGEDLLFILLITFLLFAAKKLPDLGKGVSHIIRQLTDTRDRFERELTRPAEPACRPPAPSRPWRYILTRSHEGYAAAAAAPFPRST